MRSYISFFFGTPRRFAHTLIGAFIVLAMIDHDLANKVGGMIIGKLMFAIEPFLGPVIMIAIVLFGIKVIVRGVTGKKK